MFVAQCCLLVLCSRAGLCCLVKSNRYDASEVNERLSEVVSAVRLRAAVMSVVAGRRTLMPRPVRSKVTCKRAATLGSEFELQCARYSFTELSLVFFFTLVQRSKDDVGAEIPANIIVWTVTSR